ncbi:MAG TPA: transaminase [Solirubrobacteraceae bacterium]|nr:transaminase [Solirubrobacteraceae bacterium]
MASLQELLARERETFAGRHARSAAAYQAARPHLLGGVPMTWMNLAAGGFPLHLHAARGARVTDLDGNVFVDFALGDTGAMAGHSPPATVEAIARQSTQGITAMMPTEDAAWVGAELTRRFGPTQWSFTLTATDANRWAIRLARHVTGRPKILVFAWCYHGSVDEAFALRDGDAVVARPGNVGPPVDLARTTRVAEFNEPDDLAEQLAHGDVAAVLMEPALTNIGIVLPEPGYLEQVRRLTREHGALLINDETHTISAGPGGATKAWGLEPDVVTIGKSIAGGIPSGAFGVTQELAERIEASKDADLVDTGGIGGTLAGNALSLAATRATLEHVLTDAAFERMIARAVHFTEGVQQAIDSHGLEWSVTRLGARAEYTFAAPAPRTGSVAATAHDRGLEDYLHVYLANRGILITPFHNMALMSPETTDEDVDRHTEVFVAALSDLRS